jgi:hypothetical protein
VEWGGGGGGEVGWCWGCVVSAVGCHGGKSRGRMDVVDQMRANLKMG